MKIEGKKVFTPVTITFETDREYEAFWDGVEIAVDLMRNWMGSTFDDPQYKILVDISNGFSEL